MAALYAFLTQLVLAFSEKLFGVVRDAVQKQIEAAEIRKAIKLKIQEIQSEADPITRARRMRDFLNEL